MGQSVLVSFLLLFLALLTEARLLRRLHRRRLTTQTSTNEPAYVEQPVSHFADLGKTWKQMYNYNYSTQTKRKGLENHVAFLEIGGEGAGCSITNNTMMDLWAEKYNASRFCLEHRFYGDSRPFPKQAVEALKYLSSKEMIGDVKQFIEYINKENHWIGAKWVVFGGSYSGSLAAWMRQLHPDTVVGAVASSAPLEAVLDFYQYNEVVERTIGAIESAPDCGSKIKNALLNLTVLLRSKEGRDHLSTIFKISPDLNAANLSINDVQDFYGFVQGHFKGGAQFDFPFLKQLCEIMTNETDPVTALQKVVNLERPPELIPYDIHYSNQVETLRNTTYKDVDLAGMRSWWWQTCTEFGFFQTNDYAESIFGATVSSSSFIDTCMDVFGDEFDADYITEAIKETNRYYGGSDGYNGTNVVLINGDYDPWSALGRYRSDHYSQVTYLVKGGSHCGDIFIRRKNDTAFDTVHKITAQHLDNWINGPPQIPNVDSTELNKNLKNERQRRLAKRFPTSTRTYKPQKIEFATRVTLEDLERNAQSNSETSTSRRHRLDRWKHRKTDLSKVDLDQVNITFFTQPVSHYDNLMVDTFQQQWWINAKYSKPNGPRFFMFGGEENDDDSDWIVDEDLLWVKMAAKYGATLYLNQHRCYELPTSPQRDFDLSYCNSWEALGDVKHFIESVNYQENTTGPWIVFGGSYPGMLALWARDKFPDLIRGAVGSSAPVNFKMDYYEYVQVGDHVVQQYNKSCADFLQRAYEQVHQLTMSSEGLVQLSKMFSLNPFWKDAASVNAMDMLSFSRNIADLFNFQELGLGNVQSICSKIQIDEEPVQFLASHRIGAGVSYIFWDFSSGGGYFLTYGNNFRDEVSSFQGDLWCYQTCKEFGFFMTSEYGHRIFDASSPVNFDVRLCDEAFGARPKHHVKESFSTNDIQGYIDETYEFYMSTFNATNIAAPNGNIDPWHPLGLLQRTNDQQLVFLVNGTTHGRDMLIDSNASEEMKDVQRQIEEAIGEWLKQ